MNHLLELLQPKNVLFGFKAASKEEVISKLVEHLVSTGSIASEVTGNIIQSLLTREKSMSTGIGSGVAIPHCSVAEVSEVQCAMAVSPEGIEFAALDSQLVNIFILLIVPKQKFQDHIKTLALIAKTLNIPEEREKIIKANSFEEISSALKPSL